MKNKSKSFVPDISLAVTATGAGSCFLFQGSGAKLFWPSIKPLFKNLYNLVFKKTFVFSDGIENIITRGAMRILLLSLFVSLFLVGCKENQTKSPCDGRTWKNTKEELDCRFPLPPIGRWHAVYTEAFAKEHNLPLKNVSEDLSPSIDYIEMDVQPYGKGGTACLVNMLVKKPHDIALYNLGDRRLEKLPMDRQLLQLIDIQKFKNELKATTTIHTASRDYTPRKSGYEATTFSMKAEDVLPNYDYISANAQCRIITRHPDYFPDQYALRALKASVWGKYRANFWNADNPARPKGTDYQKSLLFINIPQEIITNIFKDVPVGGQ